MNNLTFTSKQAFYLRVLTGLIFGLALAWLTGDEAANDWPSWKIMAASSLTLSAFIIWAGAGTMRRLSLLLWVFVASVLVSIISLHDHAQYGSGTHDFLSGNIFWSFPLFFIAHELVSSGDVARKFIAPYEIYFEQAWKRGVQLILALIFTQLMWGILLLGGGLLKMIGFEWFHQMTESRYFYVPATGMAMGVAVHLGDVQPKLLSTVRTLALGVMSWLLPVIVIVASIFSVSLLFSGLEPLWATRSATASLLGGCVFLVLLMNAAYGRGDDERPIPRALKYALRAASILLFIFAGLAGYALMLRIHQYGLTDERIMAAVGVIISVLFGAFYVAANFTRVRFAGFMKGIEPANIAMAFVKVFVFICLLTPIADPNRLSVNSQVARLQSGAVSIQKFDWRFLRFESGAYGTAALKKLAADDTLPDIKAAAITAQKLKDEDRYTGLPHDEEAKTFKPDASRITIVTKGITALPKRFLSQEFSEIDYNVPQCLKPPEFQPKPNDAAKNSACYVAMLDLNRDHKAEIIFMDSAFTDLKIYGETKHEWQLRGNAYGLNPAAVAAFKAGKVQAERPAYDNLKIGEQTIETNGHVTPDDPMGGNR